MKAKKHREFKRSNKKEDVQASREAYRGVSKRQPHSRSSKPAVLGSGLPTGVVHEVLAPAEKLASGAEARGLASGPTEGGTPERLILCPPQWPLGPREGDQSGGFSAPR
jgi:hypothetical protein